MRSVNIVFMSALSITQSPEVAEYGALSGRVVHLVDIENVCGGPGFNEFEATCAQRAYRRAVHVGEDDLVIVACSHYAARAAWFGWRGGRRLVKSGCDGADLALLGVIELENVCGRFDHVVIGSGDKIFAEAAAALQAGGVGVTVVSRPESLSRQLRFAARDVRLLAVDPAPAIALALRAA